MNTEPHSDQKTKSPKDIAIIYAILSDGEVLEKFQNYDLSDKIKILFTCNLFADGILNLNQLYIILVNIFKLVNLYNSLSSIFSEENSNLLFNEISNHRDNKVWAKQEIFLLLAKYVKEFPKLKNLKIPSRSINSCKNKINEITKLVTKSCLLETHEESFCATIVPKIDNEETNEIIDQQINFDPFEIESIKFSYISHQKKYAMQEKFKKQICNDKMQYMRSKRKLKEHCEKPLILLSKFDFDEKNKLNTFNEDFEYIIQRSRKNLNLGHHKAYDDKMKAFWIHEFLMGSKSFEFHKKIFQGPSINSIKKWMKEYDVPHFQEFLDIKNIEKIYLFWKSLYKIEGLDATLSVDAMKVDEDLILEKKGKITGVVRPIILKHSPDEYRRNFRLYRELWCENYKANNIIGGMFVFILCPHSSTPSFPIHVYLSNNGCANNDVDNRMMMICSQMKKLGVNIHILSSDSDTHYRESFNNQFNYIARSFVTDPNFKNFIIPEQILSNDFSHLLKRARSRLVQKHYLFISKSDQIKYYKNDINVQSIHPELIKTFDITLTDYHFRNNSHDAMDDFFPNAIFNGRSLGNAIKERHWTAVLFLLPMTCMNRILRDKVADRRYRSIWTYIGLFVMFLYWSKLKVEISCNNKERKKENFDSIFSLDFCVDCVNCFFAFLLSIRNIQEKCSISRIGTIHSEHFFASLRYIAGKEQTIKSISWAFDRVIQSRKWDYFENGQIHKRLFETGVLEEGAYELTEEEVRNCGIFVTKLYQLSGQVFPKEEAAYDLVQSFGEIDLDFNEWENDIICSLTKKDTFICKADQNTDPNWELRVSQFRFTSKAGRNIIARYGTKINAQ